MIFKILVIILLIDIDCYVCTIKKELIKQNERMGKI